MNELIFSAIAGVYRKAAQQFEDLSMGPTTDTPDSIRKDVEVLVGCLTNMVKTEEPL